MMFQVSSIEMFTAFNILLQREEPTSRVLLAAIESFARKIANRIIKLDVLRCGKSIMELDLTDDDIYKDEESRMTRNPRHFLC